MRPEISEIRKDDVRWLTVEALQMDMKESQFNYQYKRQATLLEIIWLFHKKNQGMYIKM